MSKHIAFDRATPPRTWYRAIWEWVRVKLLRKAPRYARVLSVKQGVMTVDRLPAGMAMADPVFGEPLHRANQARSNWSQWVLSSPAPKMTRPVFGVPESEPVHDPDWPEVIGE